MKGRIGRQRRRWLAGLLWLAGLALFLGLGWWNIEDSRQDAENRLISEAGRTAAQIAGLLELPGGKLDQRAARALVLAGMEDERIYAIQIHLANGVMEGLRRNYMWEPVQWDDEIAENCVQGMNPVRIDGKLKGKVNVWLSPRASEEEAGLLAGRERLRFVLIAGLWTVSYLLLLWNWGDIRHFRNLLWPKDGGDGRGDGEKIVLGLGREPEESEKPAAGVRCGAPDLVSRQEGLAYQQRNAGAWLVIAGMFRQTFGRGPALLSRLYAEGETAGLCHLGRMLEQAAPCLGAKPLARAARAMQAALNDPNCETRALPVENCARVLEQTLVALNGKNGGQTAQSGQKTAQPQQASNAMQWGRMVQRAQRQVMREQAGQAAPEQKAPAQEETASGSGKSPTEQEN